MIKATSTFIAAGVALMLSGGAFAQANNTLATPSTRSPADTSGYGTPGATNTESGTWSPNAGQQGQQSTMNPGSALPAYGGNNTLATPSTKSPVGQ